MGTETIETYDGQGNLIEIQQLEVPAQVVNERSVLDKIQQHITAAESAARTQAVWNALTAAQKDEALRRTVLAVAKMGRLLLRQFDTD